MGHEELDRRIASLNARFVLAELGLQIERRGQRLGLRGTLPPKPGSDRPAPHQQRISLGLAATADGLKQAERQLKVVAGQLLADQFNWDPYLVWSREAKPAAADLQAAVWRFEQTFFADPKRLRRLDRSRTNWHGAYEPYLKRLLAIAGPRPKETLSELIQRTVESFPFDSRARQLCVTALRAFARAEGVAFPADLEAGEYGRARLKRRQLPDDAAIARIHAGIPHPGWRFVFGLMATYGLRNHEVFYCDLSTLRDGDPEATVRVQEMTKTGEHEVWPFQPDWVEAFDLRRGELPQITTDLNETTLQRVGQRVTQQFRRYGVPFAPYDLRHAWAVRTIHIGLPDAVAAKMMGHSISIHNRTYLQWITRRDQQQAVATALGRQRA